MNFNDSLYSEKLAENKMNRLIYNAGFTLTDVLSIILNEGVLRKEVSSLILIKVITILFWFFTGICPLKSVTDDTTTASSVILNTFFKYTFNSRAKNCMDSSIIR